jgi:predicted TIM-barrel fold metal-dependent hydrolase
MCVALRNANAYFDVSNTTPDHIRQAVEQLGAERILYGSDWSATWQFLEFPSGPHSAAMDTIAKAGLSKAETELVIHGNASRLFRI